MTRLLRLWRHLSSSRRSARRLFPHTTLQAIQASIADGESRHRAEVRVVIEAALPLASVWQGHGARARAHELFSHYRLWDTEDNSGVLVYLNLADHKIEIVPDRSVGRALKPADWQSICATMSAGFARAAYHDSVLAALTQLHTLLAQHYPRSGPQHNQLSDRPLML